MNFSQSLLAAAVTGVLSTTAVGCGEKAPANDATSAAAATPSAGVAIEKHACKGQGGCKTA